MALTLESVDQRLAALESAQGETTETLRRVVTKLACMQAVQDEHTLRLDRMETKLDKLDARVGSLEAKVDALPLVMAELMEASERRIMAAVAARG